MQLERLHAASGQREGTPRLPGLRVAASPDRAPHRHVRRHRRVGVRLTHHLRYGGGLVAQVSKGLLRWAVVMLDAIHMTDPVPARLAAAVSALAARAAWSAFDVAAHEAARSLFRLALYTGVRAADPNLRAHVLADVAAQHNLLGYHPDALEVIRLAEGDERVAPAVRAVLHGVKARAYVAAGDVTGCRHHIELAEQAHAACDSAAPGWVGRLSDPALLAAATGHAMAAIAGRTGEPADRDEAQHRLTAAVDGFDPHSHARARALCLARLAALHLRAGDLEQATSWTRPALEAATSIRSARLTLAISQIRTAATEHPDQPSAQQLADQIDAANGVDAPAPGP